MRIVMKYGGTSVSNAERFLNTLIYIVLTIKKIVCIVSAMSVTLLSRAAVLLKVAIFLS